MAASTASDGAVEDIEVWKVNVIDAIFWLKLAMLFVAYVRLLVAVAYRL